MAVVSSIVATGASVVGGALSARAEEKAQEQQRDQQLNSIAAATELRERLQDEAQAGTFRGQFGNDDIFGTRRDEIDLDDSILRAVQSNQNNSSAIGDFVGGVNQDISADALDRAIRFDPNFGSNVSSLSNASRSLLRGEIPQDVQDQLLRNRAEITQQNGIPGTSGPATARDLGLTSLDLQNQGASFFQQVNSIRDQIDPLSSHIQRSQFIIDPATQVAVDQSNNQLRAAADPAAQALFGLELQGGREEAFAGAGVTVPVNNTFGAALSGAGNGAIGLLGSGLFGGNQTQAVAQPQQSFATQSLPIYGTK